MERKILFLGFLILLVIPLISAESYGENTYDCGLYGEGCSDTEDIVTPGGGGGGGGGTLLIQFDIKILDIDSPLAIGESFDFTYFIKGIGNINNDVIIDFWIEKDGEIITSGSEAIYMGSNEGKNETSSLFLPSDIESGIYQFKIKVSFGSISAESHKTIELTVDGNIVRVDQLFDISFSLEEILMEDSNELLAIVIFESFGVEPTLINLTFIILDGNGNEIHSEGESIIVETEKVLRKSFKGLNFGDGRYTLVLETLYDEDVFDEFRQDFEIRKVRIGITGMVIGWADDRKWYFVVIIMIIFLGWFIFWLLWRKKKSKKRKEKKIYKKLRKEVGNL